MRRLALVLAALCLPLLLVLPAAAQGTPTVKVTDHPQLGNILTDAQGKTLYIFTRDEANASTCYDQCAQRWPALTVTGEPAAAPGLTGTLGVTTRRDNTRQATYNQMPLYYFSGDNNPGDTAGQNVGGVWFVVAPGATRSSFAAPPPAQPAAAAPAAAAPAAAPPAAAAPQQLPRSGAAPFDPSPAVLGAALVGLGIVARIRRRGR